MARIASFRDLTTWQKSMRLAEVCYSITDTMPRSEQFGLTPQIRRSAASIPANIAEGHNRHARMAYGNFVGIALGSVAELESHLELAVRVGILTRAQVEPALALADEVGRMLRCLSRALTGPGKALEARR